MDVKTTLFYSGFQVVESVHMTKVIMEIVDIRPKGRGFVIHRKTPTIVPDPDLYMIGNKIVVGHPVTIASFRARLSQEILSDFYGRIDSAAVLGTDQQED